MNWTFSIGWLLGGLGIFLVGGAMVVFYRQISDHMLSGSLSYDRCKLWGFIIAGLGLLVMTNLHTLILTWFVNTVFHL